LTPQPIGYLNDSLVADFPFAGPLRSLSSSMDRGALLVKHAMAACAHGTKVRDWIDQVLLIDVRDLIQVMHLNVTRTKRTVLFLETEPANGAFVSMVRDACLTSGGASVISISSNKPTFSPRSTARSDA
jgi:hypothetical protein